MTGGQGELFAGPSAGGMAILRWNRTIHGRAGARHAWGEQVARLLDQDGPDALLPAFPSPHKSVREDRAETARRLHRQALAAEEPGSQQMLFDQAPPAPRTVRDEVKPAYRPSRSSAIAARDGHLAAWRAHQRGCEQCRTAWDRATSAGRRPVDEVCAVGSGAVSAASRIEVGLRRGWYPDRDKARSVAPERAEVQVSLFG